MNETHYSLTPASDRVVIAVQPCCEGGQRTTLSCLVQLRGTQFIMLVPILTSYVDEGIA